MKAAIGRVLAWAQAQAWASAFTTPEDYLLALVVLHAALEATQMDELCKAIHTNTLLYPPTFQYETKTIKYNKKVLGIYKRCEEKPTSKLTRDNRKRKTQPTPLVRMLKGDHRLSYVKEIVKSAKERRGMEHLE